VEGAVFVFLESLDEFTGPYFAGMPEVVTMPILMFNATWAATARLRRSWR
jgi:putative spermidine/putrescine transport system permease protein